MHFAIFWSRDINKRLFSLKPFLQFVGLHFASYLIEGTFNIQATKLMKRIILFTRKESKKMLGPANSGRSLRHIKPN
jgi:hypothetical protein